MVSSVGIVCFFFGVEKRSAVFFGFRSTGSSKIAQAKVVFERVFFVEGCDLIRVGVLMCVCVCGCYPLEV